MVSVSSWNERIEVDSLYNSVHFYDSVIEDPALFITALSLRGILLILPNFRFPCCSIKWVVFFLIKSLIRACHEEYYEYTGKMGSTVSHLLIFEDWSGTNYKWVFMESKFSSRLKYYSSLSTSFLFCFNYSRGSLFLWKFYSVEVEDYLIQYPVMIYSGCSLSHALCFSLCSWSPFSVFWGSFK